MPKGGILKVQSDGSLIANDAAHASLGLSTRDHLEVELVAGKYSVLRAGGGDAELIGAPGIIYAGDIRRVSVPDVLKVVHGFKADGALTFVFADQIPDKCGRTRVVAERTAVQYQ